MTSRWITLKVARIRRGLTQQRLAAAAGISESKIAKFETFRAHPADDELERLARAIGVDVEEISNRGLGT